MTRHVGAKRAPCVSTDQLAAAAIDAVGSRDFLPSMLDLLGALIPCERAQVVNYTCRPQAPSLLFSRGITSAASRIYLDHFVDHDPFRQCWVEGTARGVVTLDMAIGQHPQTGVFRARFLPLAGYIDEVSLFLPRSETDCLALFAERTEKPFTADDIAALDAGRALIESLDAADRRFTARHLSDTATWRYDHSSIRRVLTADLTDRECDVIQGMLDGLPPKRIAARLAISPGVVRNHRSSIYRKLGIASERELLGLIPSRPMETLL